MGPGLEAGLEAGPEVGPEAGPKTKHSGRLVEAAVGPMSPSAHHLSTSPTWSSRSLHHY